MNRPEGLRYSRWLIETKDLLAHKGNVTAWYALLADQIEKACFIAFSSLLPSFSLFWWLPACMNDASEHCRLKRNWGRRIYESNIKWRRQYSCGHTAPLFSEDRNQRSPQDMEVESSDTALCFQTQIFSQCWDDWTSCRIYPHADHMIMLRPVFLSAGNRR